MIPSDPKGGDATSTPAGVTPRTALVVDDHRAMRRLARRIVLDVLPDFRVDEAGDAESAVAAAAQSRPALVVMDVHLPGVDGLEATRRILGASPDSTVIVMSLADDWRYFRLATEAGATAFVPKGVLATGLPPLIAHLAD